MVAPRRTLTLILLSLVLIAGSGPIGGKMAWATNLSVNEKQPLILIDESRGIQDLSFGLLGEILLNSGYRVESMTKAEEMTAKLSTASVLVLPPSQYNLGSQANDMIADFVRKGGGLLIIGEVLYTGYNSLARTFGITMLPGIVCNPYLSTPTKPFHIKITNMQQHPVTENVNAFMYDWGQPMTVSTPALSLATAGDGSWYETDVNGVKDANDQLGQYTVLACSEFKSGRVVAAGDVGCFALYVKLQWSPLQTYDTARLALNIFNWLSRSNLNGPRLDYTVTVTADLAARHIARVQMKIQQSKRSDIKLMLSRWQDGSYYYSGIANLEASTPNGSSLTVSYGEEREMKIWTLKTDCTNVTVQYDIGLDYVRKDHDEYGGYLGPRFCLSQAAQLFLAPVNTFFSEITLNFNLPSGWQAYAPWSREGESFAPDPARAAIINYGLSPGMKEFLWATFGLGDFVEQSRTVSQTEVRIACWAEWDTSAKEAIWKTSFNLYEYTTRLFGRSAPLTRYMAIWTPRAEDGRGICMCEWSSSQGLHTDPPKYYAFSNYEHRLFHIWNAFEPTGMAKESSSEHWISEGMNIYYNSKAMVEMGFAEKGRILISEYNWYLQEIVGTRYDVPLTEAYKYGNRQEFDQYIWLGYRKGALVSYVLDVQIQKLTNGSKSLDDLQKLMYELYGAHRGCYSTKDVQRHLETLVGQSFQSFFESYVYGATKLPLSLEGDNLVVKL